MERNPPRTVRRHLRQTLPTGLAVFLPLFIPREGLIPLSLTVEEGLKRVVSDEIVLPEHWESSAGMPAPGIGEMPL